MHLRDMRRNIWRGLLTATDQEIHEGMHFYEGAYGLCKMLAMIYNKSVSTIAGIYAALSPMNTWDTNVSNIIDVLRWSTVTPPASLEALKVNTTHKNRDKAILIARGEDPLYVLGKGPKVRAFYQAINTPDDRSHYPIDRHLINLALGTKITNNIELRSVVTREYSRVEKVYRELGDREKLGNRLTSIAWFVQRRSGLLCLRQDKEQTTIHQ